MSRLLFWSMESAVPVTVRSYLADIVAFVGTSFTVDKMKSCTMDATAYLAGPFTSLGIPSGTPITGEVHGKIAGSLGASAHWTPWWIGFGK